MAFDQELFTNILKLIEEKLIFSEDSITSVHGWSLHLKLNVQEIVDKYPNKTNNIKYILKVLERMDCIKFAVNDASAIDTLMDNGYKLIFSYLHKIEFKF